MDKQEILYDKLKKFRDSTGLSVTDCAQVFSVGRATILTIQQKQPNAGDKSDILHKLEIFELFPQVSTFCLSKVLTALSIEGQKKAIAYIARITKGNHEESQEITKTNDRFKKISTFHSKVYTAIDRIINQAMQGEEDESMKETYFNHIQDIIKGLDYISYSAIKRQKQRRFKKKVKGIK